MRKSWLKKAFVCGIIMLFVGTSVVTGISRNIQNNELGNNEKSITKHFDAFITSDFENDLDGWSAIGDGVATWIESGGNPGGWMRIEDDVQDHYAWAKAPSKFLGDWESLGITYISADVEELSLNPYEPFDFEISGPGGTADYNSGIIPTTSWQIILAPLQESAWNITQGTWEDIISNVTEFLVDAEFNNGQEKVGIDNVILYNVPSIPVANFIFTPGTPLPNQTITFDASSSFAFGGYITLYEWDWNNDGTYEENHINPITTHSWTSEGNYSVTLRVTDNNSITDVITRIVVVHIPNIFYVGGSGHGNYTLHSGCCVLHIEGMSFLVIVLLVLTLRYLEVVATSYFD